MSLERLYATVDYSSKPSTSHHHLRNSTDEVNIYHTFTMSAEEVQANGWTAVPVDGKQIIDGARPLSAPASITFEEISFPSDDPLVLEAQTFAKQRLSVEAFNHSMRVYYWGTSSTSSSIA